MKIRTEDNSYQAHDVWQLIRRKHPRPGTG